MMQKPIDSGEDLTIIALVASRTYVSISAETELDRIKRQSPTNIIKVNNPQNFQNYLASGRSKNQQKQSHAQICIWRPHFCWQIRRAVDYGWPTVVLHFIGFNGVVIGTTPCLISSLQLTLQVKNANSEMSAIPLYIPSDDNLAIFPMTAETITAFLIQPSERNSTSAVTTLFKITETASFPFAHKIKYLEKKTSSQSNQHNRVTIYDQKAHRFASLCSDSDAIGVYRTSRHGNLLYDSGRYSASEHVSELAIDNESIRKAELYILAPHTRNYWQN